MSEAKRKATKEQLSLLELKESKWYKVYDSYLSKIISDCERIIFEPNPELNKVEYTLNDVYKIVRKVLIWLKKEPKILLDSVKLIEKQLPKEDTIPKDRQHPVA